MENGNYAMTWFQELVSWAFFLVCIVPIIILVLSRIPAAFRSARVVTDDVIEQKEIEAYQKRYREMTQQAVENRTDHQMVFGNQEPNAGYQPIKLGYKCPECGGSTNPKFWQRPCHCIIIDD